MFGSTNNNQTTGGGLFGSTNQQPQQQQTSLFGNTNNNQQQQNSSPFGASSGGLFGQKPATTAPTGGLFGSSPAPATGGGLFGNPAGGSSLFGGGNNTNPFGSSTLGQSQPASGGLFGAPRPAAPATTGMFGSSTMGGGGLFGSQNQQQQPQQQQQMLQASIDQNPYGRNPLFESTGPVTLPAIEPLPEKKLPSAQLMSASFGNRMRTSQSAKGLARLRGFNSPTTSQNGRSSPSNNSSLNGSTGRASPSRQGQLYGLSDEPAVVLSPHAFVSRNSVKKLVVDRKVGGADVLGMSRSSSAGGLAGSPSDGSRLNGSANGRPKVTFDSQVDIENFFVNDSSHSITPARKPVQLSFLEDTPSKTAGQERLNASTLTAKDIGGSSNGSKASPSRAEVPLKTGDYFMKPNADALLHMAHQDLLSLSSFTVGRVGYGEVTFLEPVDLTLSSSISDIPGTLVVFTEKVCEVYPDNVEKAPEGSGLNVPARITLERCWPVDKATREPVKEEDHPRMRSHLRTLKNMAETEFESFKAETGTWVFKVKHFSRYGLIESDGEDEDDQAMDKETRSNRRAKKEEMVSTTPRAAPPRRVQPVASQPSQSNMSVDEDQDEDAPPANYASDDSMHSSPSEARNARRSASASTVASSSRRTPAYSPPKKLSQTQEDSDDDAMDAQSFSDDASSSQTDASFASSDSDDGFRPRPIPSNTSDSDEPTSSSRPWASASASMKGLEPRKVQVMQQSFFRSGVEKKDAGATPKATRFLSTRESGAQLVRPQSFFEEEGEGLVSRSIASQVRVAFSTFVGYEADPSVAYLFSDPLSTPRWSPSRSLSPPANSLESLRPTVVRRIRTLSSMLVSCTDGHSESGGAGMARSFM